ncbi:glucose-6-phosphate isomerase, partial [candidate division KSB1 bacterium]|nr:glucose-6-phosphate isomerase [candidate division KSB1 bacterium]
KPDVLKAQKALEDHTGAGNDFHGWLDLPTRRNHELDDIKKAAHTIRSEAKYLICIGIGGSYLGAQATISSLGNQIPCSKTKGTQIFFAGHNMSSQYLAELIKVVDWSKTMINVISKSGTTTEPGLAFRVLYDQLEKKVGKQEANRRVIATTDKSRGALKKMATENSFQTFVIPDDVGGRFSVLTAVGLLPIAAAGIDVDKLLEGASKMRDISRSNDLYKNPALLYAALRNILYRKDKSIEILANFEPALHNIGEWWKQLFGESEGKAGKGLFPVSVDLSTDLHSMGQMIQEGLRHIFETFIFIEDDPTQLPIPHWKDNYDGFNYLAGKTLHFVNQKAYEGTAQAHKQGGCPNMTIILPRLSEFYLGQLFYFFEYAVAISGYVLGVNPFDQPGVEAYKSNMFRLLGKTGF